MASIHDARGSMYSSFSGPTDDVIVEDDNESNEGTSPLCNFVKVEDNADVDISNLDLGNDIE